MRRFLLLAACSIVVACGARSSLGVLGGTSSGAGGGATATSTASAGTTTTSASTSGGLGGFGGGAGGATTTTTTSSGTGGTATNLAPCPVTTCTGGACPPVALAAQTRPVWIGLATSTLFWVADNPPVWVPNDGVRRVQKDGTGEELLWGGYYVTGNAGLDTSAVYVGMLQASVPKLLRVPIVGGASQMLASFAPGNYPLSAVAAGTDLYYTAQEATGVALHRVGTDGTGDKVLRPGLGATTGQFQSLAVDDQFVYLVDGELPGMPLIDRISRTSGWLEVVASSASEGPIVLDGGYVYQGGFATPSSIHRFSLQGGADETVVPGVAANFVAVYGDMIYFVNEGDESIGRAPKAGGAAEVLITGAVPVSLAVDGSGLYYGDDKSGTLCWLAL